MRVLLLGATGNLGSRCIPTLLAHNHNLTVYVRNPAKLHALISPLLISRLTIVVGDATDATGIKSAILDNDCDALVDTAGNQVLPWKENLLAKIARAVSDAATEAGKERGMAMRVWLIGGLGVLEYPGTGYLLQDYLPAIASAQHQGTLSVLESVPLSAVRWSLLCVAVMKPALATIEALDAPRDHQLVIKAGSPPEWEDHWVRNLPLVGMFLNLVVEVAAYTTQLEDVADLMAEDLKSGSEEWVGKKVGMKQRRKAD